MIESPSQKKAAELAGFLLSNKRVLSAEILAALDGALQAITDGFSFKVEVIKPNIFAAFLKLDEPTAGMFNQLASETSFWQLLDQIEESCFGKPEVLEKARPFIVDLWQDKVSANPFKAPKWRYLPVEEAVAAFRKIFGSSLRADSVLKLARQAKSDKDTEGVPVWIKLSTLARIFGVEGNPLESTHGGREAYAGVVTAFIPKVGEAYIASGLGGFRNWRENQLTADHIILTPAGLQTWQLLEAMTEDDFVIAPAGASTGSWYGGYAVCRSRLCITLSGDQMPQDCVMTGGTIAIQPDRMSKYEHLGMDCPANAYSPDADGEFEFSVYWSFGDGKLPFGCRWAGNVRRSFGGAVFSRP